MLDTFPGGHRMTDDELIKFIDEHRHWAPKRLFAFLMANIDVKTLKSQRARELVNETVASGNGSATAMVALKGSIASHLISSIRSPSGRINPRSEQQATLSTRVRARAVADPPSCFRPATADLLSAVAADTPGFLRLLISMS
jgi:hypothetical protein